MGFLVKRMVVYAMSNAPHTAGPPTILAPSDDERWHSIEMTMRRLGFRPDALIETLHSVQEAFGYLDDPALAYVAHSLKLPLSKVYGVATFYSLFHLKPHGVHTCEVCMGTACFLKGGAAILAAAEQITGVTPGETMADNKVTLLIGRCLGACGIAPMALFDGAVAGYLTPEAIESLIAEWADDGK
jgi:bidirectional [NiFe] hydrogenase diaphorase subunit